MFISLIGSTDSKLLLISYRAKEVSDACEGIEARQVLPHQTSKTSYKPGFVIMSKEESVKQKRFPQMWRQPMVNTITDFWQFRPHTLGKHGFTPTFYSAVS